MAFEVTLEGPGPWGFRVTGGKDQGVPLSICRLISSGKAAEAKIREKDIILEINGEPTTETTLADASSKIRDTENDLRLKIKRGTYYFTPLSPSSPNKESPKLPWKQGQSSPTTRSTSSVTISLARNKQEDKNTPSENSHLKLQDPPKSKKEINQSEERMVEVEKSLDLVTFDVEPSDGKVVNFSEGKKDENENLVTIENQVKTFTEESSPAVGKETGKFYTAYSTKREQPEENCSEKQSGVWSPNSRPTCPPTYDTVYTRQSEISPGRESQRSPQFDKYTRSPQPFSRQPSPKTYTPVIIRSPLTKAQLFVYHPEDADVESLESGESPHSTVSKEDIVREQQFEPMRSPTRIPGYYGRLAYEARSRDVRTYSNSPARGDANAYFSDGDVMNTTPSSFTRKSNRRSPLNSPKQSVVSSIGTHGRSRTRRDELPSSASLKSEFVTPSNQQYYSDVDDQYSPYVNRTFNPYPSDAEEPIKHHSLRYIAPSNQYYSDADIAHVANSNETGKRTKRYISRAPASNQYYSDTEGYSKQPTNLHVTPSNQYINVASEPTLHRSINHRHVTPGNQYYNEAEKPVRYITRGDPTDNYYSDTEGYLSRRSNRFTGGSNGYVAGQRRASGEVVRTPQFQPSYKEPSLPKYYNKLGVFTSDDASVAMSDTEAMSSNYSRRRRARHHEENGPSSVGHFSITPKTAWNETPSLTNSRHGHEHLVRTSSSDALYQPDRHCSNGIHAPTDSNQLVESSYTAEIAPINSNSMNGNQKQKFNGFLDATDTFLPPTGQGPLATGTTWRSEAIGNNKTENIKSPSDDKSLELFERYFGNVQEYQNATKSMRSFSPASAASWHSSPKYKQSSPTSPSSRTINTPSWRTTEHEPDKPVKRHVGVDKDSPVYKTVHEFQNQPNKAGDTNSTFVGNSEEDELEYHNYTNHVVQSPTFMRLNQILEVEEENGKELT
ncbi:uncharacterized protein LOC144452209 [Glandiceps talaboti]